MTVCGISKADGVCVMGKCPYVKVCSQAEWDKGGIMLDPFDSEFLSQELRESWKKIEELEKENEELRERLEFYKKNYNPYWAGEMDE